jgi:hypothetical protein
MPSSAPTYDTLSHILCQDYAVHARGKVAFDGAQSTIHSGDVGLFNPDPAATIYNANPTIYLDGGPVYAASESFANSVTANLAVFLALPGNTTAVEIGGTTFLPGTYRSSGALNIAVNTVVTLDGNNETNPTFIFISPTEALTVGANVNFILKDGARFENIFWVLGTAATLGAYITLPGSILAGTSITFGEGSGLEGCALAQVSVTFEASGFVTSGKY